MRPTGIGDWIRARPLVGRLGSGVLWSGVATVASRGLALVASIIAARALGREAFGAFGLIQSTSLMLQTVVTVGLGFTISKHVAEYRDRDRARAGRVIALGEMLGWVCGSIAGIGVFAFAPAIAMYVFADAGLVGPLRLAVPTIVLGGVLGVQTGALAGLEAFRGVARSNAFVGAFAAVAISVGVAGFGLRGALVGAAVGAGLGVVASRRVLKEEARARLVEWTRSGWKLEVGLIHRAGIPAILATLATAPPYWVGNAMLARSSGGLEQMGVFSAAYQWRTLVLFVPSLLNGIMISILSNVRAQGDSRKYRAVLAINVLANAAVPLAGAALIWAAWRPILASYGPDFVNDAARSCLVIVALSAAPAALALVAMQVLTSAGRMWDVFLMNVVWGLALVYSAHGLVATRGASGLALAHCIANVAQVVVAAALVYRARDAARGLHAMRSHLKAPEV